MVLYQNYFIYFSEEDTKEKCVSKFKDDSSKLSKMIQDKTLKDNEKYPCHLWNGTKCRKGFFDKDNKQCVADNDIIPFIIFCISIIFGIVCIISLFI
jgi:hypothetical protein